MIYEVYFEISLFSTCLAVIQNSTTSECTLRNEIWLLIVCYLGNDPTMGTTCVVDTYHLLANIRSCLYIKKLYGKNQWFIVQRQQYDNPIFTTRKPKKKLGAPGRNKLGHEEL